MCLGGSAATHQANWGARGQVRHSNVLTAVRHPRVRCAVSEARVGFPPWLSSTHACRCCAMCALKPPRKPCQHIAHIHLVSGEA